MFYAHSENKAHQKHAAKEHLAGVEKIAVEYAGNAWWREECSLSGLLHDLGKYADLFQARLRGEIHGLDHWSPGAWAALTEYKSVGAALSIQGHHLGLQKGDVNALRAMNPTTLAEHHPLHLKISNPDIGVLTSRAIADGLSCIKPKKNIIDPAIGFTNPLTNMLDVRMLFSCLVDADFIDTEAHFEGNEFGKHYRQKGPSLDMSKALRTLDNFMIEAVRSRSNADPNVLDARNSLWKMVSTSAVHSSSLYTLTAPTGSGKTLAMLKFALEHAATHLNLKRIILAVPFLSIIEQTAAIYRTIFRNFPENYILEHHSLAGLGNEETRSDAEGSAERARRLLSENWDAPIVITTNVQLLESLFSNRPSVCRKLHNMMDSIIMFDEAQTLPQSLAVPTLAVLSHLSTTYRTTVLFATATQPAFDALDKAVKVFTPNGGWKPIEAVPGNASLYKKLRRYEVFWPEEQETKNWGALADEIRGERQVLCVVNLKSHASDILEELKQDPDIFHLSTNLCALHRRMILDRVRRRLIEKQPCRLISTQCVEAGVDVDFPVVYRALAPLDAIAQAAGRCNREGRLADKNGIPQMGSVRIFEPDAVGNFRKRYPTHAYFQATEVTRSMLIESGRAGLDLNDPAIYRDYYRRLYDVSKPEAQNESLANAIKKIDFISVAKEYRLIDQAAIQVLVPYTPYREQFETLQFQQSEEGISAKWIRRAQGMAVSIFRPKLGHPAWEVLIPAKLRHGKGESDEWYILEDRNGEFYDEVFGLHLPRSQQIFIG